MIKYKSGYKYQLAETYEITTDFGPFLPVVSSYSYITLTNKGVLIISKGYAWDGPSGPTIDTKNFMRGSLVHDALYQLMREELLDSRLYRDKADKLLQQLCREDGMSRLRAWWVYLGVSKFASFAAKASQRKQIIKAP